MAGNGATSEFARRLTGNRAPLPVLRKRSGGRTMGRLLSQLAHVELITPKPDESLKFFTDVMGLIETARRGNSVYLRGWGSHLHHELVLTEGPAPALGHIGWRAAGPYELEVAVERLETGGAGVGWHTDTPGHGPAFR